MCLIAKKSSENSARDDAVCYSDLVTNFTNVTKIIFLPDGHFNAEHR